MGSSPAPAAPDYVGAAQAQGQANLQAAVATGRINNPNVINPYGTQTVTWGKGGSNATPTVTQQLTPVQQALFDKTNTAKGSLANAGIAGARNVQNNLSQNLSFSGLDKVNVPNTQKLNNALPTVVNKSSEARRNDVMNSMMSRVNEDTAGQRSQKNSELIASGIRPGTEAYKNAMTQIDRQYNDARSQATLAAGQEASRDFALDQGVYDMNANNLNIDRTNKLATFGMDESKYSMGQANRNQAIFEMLQQRQVPLNEINALLSGSQVSSPFAGNLGYQAGANVGAAPIAGAVNAQGQAQQNQYNQQQAQTNSNVNAGAGLIGSLGSAWIGR